MLSPSWLNLYLADNPVMVYITVSYLIIINYSVIKEGTFLSTESNLKKIANSLLKLD